MDTLVQFKTHISTPSIKLKYAYLSLKMTTGKTFTIPWYWSDSDIQSVANERGFESNCGCGGGGCWYGLGRRELLPMWRWLSSAVVAQAGRGAGGLRAVAAPPVQAKQGSRQETLPLSSSSSPPPVHLRGSLGVKVRKNQWASEVEWGVHQVWDHVLQATGDDTHPTCPAGQSVATHSTCSIAHSPPVC